MPEYRFQIPNVRLFSPLSPLSVAEKSICDCCDQMPILLAALIKLSKAADHSLDFTDRVPPSKTFRIKIAQLDGFRVIFLIIAKKC